MKLKGGICHYIGGRRKQIFRWRARFIINRKTIWGPLRITKDEAEKDRVQMRKELARVYTQR